MVRIVFVLLFFAAIFWIIRSLIGGGGFGREAPFQCRNCRHCRKLFDDGVRCVYGDKEVFKNPAQIGMCHDHTKR